MKTISCTARDVPMLRLSHKLLGKAITQATTALATLNVESDEIGDLAKDAQRFGETLDGNVGRESWSLNPELVNAGTLGLSILLGKLEKLQDAQLDLMVPVSETQEKQDEARALHDRLKGVATPRTMFEEA